MGTVEHIPTLKIFDDYLAAGYSEKEARCAVYTLNTVFDSVATKKDIERLEKSIEKDISNLENKLDSKITSIKRIGWAMFAVFCLPFVQKFLMSFAIINRWMTNL